MSSAQKQFNIEHNIKDYFEIIFYYNCCHRSSILYEPKDVSWKVTTSAFQMRQWLKLKEGKKKKKRKTESEVEERQKKVGKAVCDGKRVI